LNIYTGNFERSPFRGSSVNKIENRRGFATTTAGGTDNID